jgi:hypothetical protein
VPTDSFYARLADVRSVCSPRRCEDYVSFYGDSLGGRPFIPAAMIVLAMLLQYRDERSDAEVKQRMRFHLIALFI